MKALLCEVSLNGSVMRLASSSMPGKSGKGVVFFVYSGAHDIKSENPLEISSTSSKRLSHVC